MMRISQFPLRTLMLIFLLSFCMLSCEQDIDITLPQPELSYVVDGYIENDQFAEIFITKSIPYFEQVDLETLLGTIVTDATVILSDGILSETLQLTFKPEAFPPIVYKGNNPALKGKLNHSYTLTVIIGKDTITSSTYIPSVVSLDSIYWLPDDSSGNFGFGWGHFRDPDTLGNFYRILAKRQEYPDYRAGNRSVSDDRLVNGLPITFSFIRPRPTPRLLTNDTLLESGPLRVLYERGDTIYVKFCSISQESYEYIRTYEVAAGSFGNPFSAPTFVKSNIRGGLGGFVGYAASYHSYIVPQ